MSVLARYSINILLWQPVDFRKFAENILIMKIILITALLVSGVAFSRDKVARTNDKLTSSNDKVFLPNDKLIGRWESRPSEKGAVTTVVFRADNSFDGYVNNKPFVNGTYTLNDSIFTMVDNGCNGVRGTYTIHFFSNGDSMRLECLQDSCAERCAGASRIILGRKKPADKVSLGKLLFFDPILSSDKTISCASCHKPGAAFADTAALSVGVHGRKGVRNTPSAMNLSLQSDFFWDGRAKSLEEQALGPIANPVEMDLPIEVALGRLGNNAKYRQYFMEVFNAVPSRANLGAAIAAYERSLETNNSPFDNWRLSGNEKIVPDAVKRGFVVFNNKGKCVRCHFGADFTTHEFRNIGLFDGKKLKDSGRGHCPDMKWSWGSSRCLVFGMWR